jgi:predicted transglutaminase-like cysteine proteinase
MRAAARVLAVLCLAVPCGGAAVARSAADFAAAPDPVARAPQIAALPPHSAFPSPTPGPFGLVVSRSGAMAKRWQLLQPALRTDAEILGLCRANPQICPAPAARFLAIIDAARARSGRARIGEINRAINLAIRPADDLARFHVPDIWTTALATFATGMGDCEDYAIAKYAALREVGMADADLRLVIVHDRLSGQDHAVVAARLEAEWLILDNRTMRLSDDASMRNVTPLVALDGGSEDRAPLLVTDQHPLPLTSVALASRN